VEQQEFQTEEGIMTNALCKCAFWTFIVAIGSFLLLPTVVIIPVSFTSSTVLDFPPVGWSLQWYQSLTSTPVWRDAIATSAKVAASVAVIATVLGTAAAIGLHKSKATHMLVIRVLLLSPLVTPSIVLAIGFFFVYSSWGIAGDFIGLVVAHTVIALPFVVVSVSSALHALNPNWELAAKGLGSGVIRSFLRVTLPVISPGVAAGAIFAFITSWDEVVAAIFLTNSDLRTVPVEVWGQVRANLDPSIAAIGTLLIATSILGLGCIYLLQWRQNEAVSP
jgi:putative spermidine/putrescine transport system permease protein